MPIRVRFDNDNHPNLMRCHGTDGSDVGTQRSDVDLGPATINSSHRSLVQRTPAKKSSRRFLKMGTTVPVEINACPKQTQSMLSPLTSEIHKARVKILNSSVINTSAPRSRDLRNRQSPHKSSSHGK